MQRRIIAITTLAVGAIIAQPPALFKYRQPTAGGYEFSNRFFRHALVENLLKRFSVRLVDSSIDRSKTIKAVVYL